MEMPASYHTGIASSEDVSTLIEKCCSGDDAARAIFVNTYAETIRRTVVKKLGQILQKSPVREDVEDITNDVITRLLDRNCKLLTSLHNPKCITAWLITLTNNHVVDYIRKHRARMRVQFAHAHHTPNMEERTPAHVVMEQESVYQVRRQVDALPGIDRLLILMYYVDGLKYAEIAAITSMNINTIATRLHRTKNKLRKTLETMNAIDRYYDSDVSVNERRTYSVEEKI